MDKCLCGCDQKVKPGNKFINGHNSRINNPMSDPEIAERAAAKNRGKKRSKESCERYRESKKGKFGEETNAWKGGCIEWYHREAWILFSKHKCEVCGITNKDHKRKTNMRLSMHCRTKDYKLLEEWNWITVCHFGCHQKMEYIDGKENKFDLKWR